MRFRSGCFADCVGPKQDVMEPFSERQEDGSMHQLRLSEREFQSVMSLVEDAEEPEYEGKATLEGDAPQPAN